MTGPDLTDETLMAYADGALPEAEASAIAAALESDREAAAKVAVFRETRDRLAGAAAARDDVPAALRARVEGMIDDHVATRAAENVTSFAARRDAGAGPAPRPWVMALAASIALAVGLGAGYGLRGTGVPESDARLALLPEAALRQTLDTLPSGETAETADGAVTAVASFRAGDGRLCREMEVARPDAALSLVVLCRKPGAEWEPQFALRLGGADGYAPASGLETLETFLDGLGAGPPLTLEQEGAALDP